MIFDKPKPKVRVFVQDGPTIEGVLMARTKTEFVLRAAKVLEGKEPVELSSEALIPRERVLWWQRIG